MFTSPAVTDAVARWIINDIRYYHTARNAALECQETGYYSPLDDYLTDVILTRRHDENMPTGFDAWHLSTVDWVEVANVLVEE